MPVKYGDLENGERFYHKNKEWVKYNHFGINIENGHWFRFADCFYVVV